MSNTEKSPKAPRTYKARLVGVFIAVAILAVIMASCGAREVAKSGSTDTSAADARVASCQRVIAAMNTGVQGVMVAFEGQLDLTMSAAAGGSVESILAGQEAITQQINDAEAELAATTATCE